MQIEILFEDQDIVVINKPPDLVVNKADSVKVNTLQDWLETRLISEKAALTQDWHSLMPMDFDDEFGSPAEIFSTRGGIVHRLDKDTSGVMVLAKNPGSLINLLAQFKCRAVSKEYLCLTHGKFNLQHGTVALPLGRSSRDRRHFAVDLEGRVAVTEYQVEKWYSGLDVVKLKAKIQLPVNREMLNIYQQGFSLVRCWPKTGRTHQIRVHLTTIQHPLVGDITYIGRKRAKLDPLWCPRQFLHATQLNFNHPRTGKPLIFKADLSQDLAKVLDLLNQAI